MGESDPGRIYFGIIISSIDFCGIRKLDSEDSSVSGMLSGTTSLLSPPRTTGDSCCWGAG